MPIGNVVWEVKVKHTKSFIMLFGVLCSLAGLAFVSITPASAVIPTTSIVSVVEDSQVTIQTYNFPAGLTFDVRMGYFGTAGVNGILVTSTYSGSGGSFTATYNIPGALKGQYKIAIRLENLATGYYAYDWFYNNPSGSSGGTTVTPVPGYTGVPTFSITGVVTDSQVTIQTSNFPANLLFDVRMGYFGNAGINGTLVTTTNSGAGGAFAATYDIPASMKGQYKIAIRLENPATGYYAYNWFYNNTSGSTGGTGGPYVTPATGYTGYPSFSIISVIKDSQVTIQAYNFPANTSFNVRMGDMGSAGIGGVLVTTINSGIGGTFTATYDIPASLQGQSQIAIRLENTSAGYYAYNWFYNS
jgi:hypothetical protein